MPLLEQLSFVWIWRLRRARRAMQRLGPVLLLAVGALAFAAYLAAGTSPPRALWEALAIFAVGGEPEATEHLAAGGPADQALWASLWALRVVAPLLVGGAVLDFAAALLPEPREVPATVSGHVVVVGAGDLGQHLVDVLRARRELVVVVDRSEHADHVGALRRDGVPVLVGDGRRPDVLLRAGVDRARLLVAATGDDRTNESVALLGLAVLAPEGSALQAVAHVDGGHACRERASRWLPEAGLARFHAFDAFEEVARRLLDGWTAPAGPSTVIIAGCGRFGRAILGRLRRALHDRPEVALVAVDRDPTVRDALDAQGGRPVTFHPWDLLGPEIRALIAATTGPCVGFVCTDDDAHNIVFTQHLRAAHDVDVAVVTRLSEWPEHRGRELEDKLGEHVHIASFQHLLERGLQADLDRWLAAAPPA